jgi:hypothetical protein
MVEFDGAEMRQHPPTSPFFIVGSPRSGTTLLRFMLSSHSRIYVPDETGFIPFLHSPVDAPLDRTQIRAVLDRIGRLNRFWRDMVTDFDAFCESLPEPRLNSVLDALYRLRIAERGAVRWGDKTPLYVQYIPFLHRLFPDAQFIHVIRDGRDSTLSAIEKWGSKKPYFDAYYLLKQWMRNVSAGQAAGQALGSDRYLEVRYEDLVSHPEVTIREICSFLVEAFELNMLDQTHLASEIGGGLDHHNEVQQPVTADHRERWVAEMSTFDKKLADHLAGSTLTSLGYPPAALGSFGHSEKLRLRYLASKFRLTDTLRTVLYKGGILTLNRNRKS